MVAGDQSTSRGRNRSGSLDCALARCRFQYRVVRSLRSDLAWIRVKNVHRHSRSSSTRLFDPRDCGAFARLPRGMRLFDHAGAKAQCVDARPRRAQSGRSQGVVSAARGRAEVSPQRGLHSAGGRQGPIHHGSRPDHASRHDRLRGRAVRWSDRHHRSGQSSGDRPSQHRLSGLGGRGRHQHWCGLPHRRRFAWSLRGDARRLGQQ